MKTVVIFTGIAFALVPLVILVILMGITVDPNILSRLNRPEEAYVMIEDESFRTNDKESTYTKLSIYSDNQVNLNTYVNNLSVNPAIDDDAAELAYTKAKGLGLTNILFINREDCAEPFTGQIRLNLGYFVKNIPYTQCREQKNPAVQNYHQYLKDTFTIGGS